MEICLKNLAENDYKIFSQKLIPDAKILGVRTPKIKNLAKNIIKSYDINEILDYLKIDKIYHEEILLDGFIINSLKISENLRVQLSKDFVHKINNWAICDAFAEIKKKNLSLWREFIIEYKNRKKEFEARFFYVSFFKNFKKEDDMRFFLNSLKITKFYYVNMAMAWGICEYATIFEEEIYEFLKFYKDKKVKNLAIKKIKESLKFTKESKNKFDELLRLEFY